MRIAITAAAWENYANYDITPYGSNVQLPGTLVAYPYKKARENDASLSWETSEYTCIPALKHDHQGYSFAAILHVVSDLFIEFYLCNIKLWIIYGVLKNYIAMQISLCMNCSHPIRISALYMNYIILFYSIIHAMIHMKDLSALKYLMHIHTTIFFPDFMTTLREFQRVNF